MDDILPTIRIRITGDPVAFLDKMADIAQDSGDFEVEKNYERLHKRLFVVTLRFTKGLPDKSLVAQLIVKPANEGLVDVEIADRQRHDTPSYETYCAEAKILIIPLLQRYNRDESTRYHMTIPTKEKIQPKLPPQAALLFRRFAGLANKSCLNDGDWQRFYEFVRDCRSRDRYSEEDIARLLMNEGFDEEYARNIGEIYFHLCGFIRFTRMNT